MAEGLNQLGNGAWAWLAHSNSWGWSNAGLISDGEESLLVDTLYDLRLTAEMLSRMRCAEPLAANFETARDIELCEYSSWSDPERIAVNVDSLYREFSGEQTMTDVLELFSRMAALAGYDDSTASTA